MQLKLFMEVKMEKGQMEEWEMQVIHSATMYKSCQLWNSFAQTYITYCGF